MKRYIHCTTYDRFDESESDDSSKDIINEDKNVRLTNADIVRILNDHGIDTTKQEYELCAEAYDRYSNGGIYRKKFKCPGDYLAYFSMVLNCAPKASIIEDYFGTDGFEEMIQDYPTVQDIADHASASWWGDGGDYIIYLKNLTTGKYLYKGNEEDVFEEFEEDWEE